MTVARVDSRRRSAEAVTYESDAPAATRVGARNRAGLATRELLMDVAVRLFAERGIEKVSVREITEAAGANLSAVNYYFGSKQDLIEALIERGAEEYGRRREASLRELESDPSPDLRAVVSALVHPAAALVSDSDEGRKYIQFLNSIVTYPRLLTLMNEAYDEHTNRFLTLLERVTPELDETARLVRFAATKELVYQFLGGERSRIASWLSARTRLGETEIVEALVDMALCFFSEPTPAWPAR